MDRELVVLFPKLGRVLTVLALSACVAAGPGAKKDAPNPVTGPAIEVTALEDPVGLPARPPEGATAPAAATGATGAAGAEVTPRPQAEAAAKPDAAAAAVPAPAVARAEKSPAQLACEKRGDVWAKAGSSGANACVKRLNDGGKRCTNGTQCQGECLARSNTCAPMTPLFGCNEILQDNGSRVTLCLN